MPSYIKRLRSSGLEKVDYSATSLEDAARFEPRDGVYTTTNTFEVTKVLKLDAHLDRLEESARLAHISLVLDRPHLRAGLRQLILESGFGDVRFRITVPADAPHEFILTVEPFTPLAAEIIAQGVKCAVLNQTERHNPAAKTTEWLKDRKQIESTLPQGTFGLLLDEDGHILEGTSSNFYVILNGELRTASAGVLAGIAQQIVFEVAPSILPVRREAIHMSELESVTEAFLTSASRGIVPIVQVDALVIGAGIPGEKTLALRAAYQTWMQHNLEEL